MTSNTQLTRTATVSPPRALRRRAHAVAFAPLHLRGPQNTRSHATAVSRRRSRRFGLPVAECQTPGGRSRIRRADRFGRTEPTMRVHDPRLPASGDVVVIGPKASVQFKEQFLFGGIRILPWETFDGWCWLDGYVLDRAGDAVERRRLFLQILGLRLPEPGNAVNQPRRSRSPGKARDHYTNDRPVPRREEA